MRFRFVRVVYIAVMLLSVIVAACSSNNDSRDQDLVDIRKVLEQRNNAIENKDLSLYKSLIFPEYFDGGASLEQILSEMEYAFKQHETIAFTYQKSPVEFQMNTARVVQRIIYRVAGEEKGRHGHERLILRKLDGKWIISGGIQTGLLGE